ncbi:hypothetical protein GGX14DRAFT_398992 [Mycena pura]|uniref:Uncharacterized protein n=1 Tax=Mycena pura TaxID=153505 RepID=A0AAD6V975_9AGAR|nr:hypothetical protein GGX14DRAFT_398992 [Mycena pura]
MCTCTGATQSRGVEPEQLEMGPVEVARAPAEHSIKAQGKNKYKNKYNSRTSQLQNRCRNVPAQQDRENPYHLFVTERGQRRFLQQPHAQRRTRIRGHSMRMRQLLAGSHTRRKSTSLVAGEKKGRAEATGMPSEIQVFNARGQRPHPREDRKERVEKEPYQRGHGRHKRGTLFVDDLAWARTSACTSPAADPFSGFVHPRRPGRRWKASREFATAVTWAADVRRGKRMFMWTRPLKVFACVYIAGRAENIEAGVRRAAEAENDRRPATSGWRHAHGQRVAGIARRGRCMRPAACVTACAATGGYRSSAARAASGQREEASGQLGAGSGQRAAGSGQRVAGGGWRVLGWRVLGWRVLGWRVAGNAQRATGDAQGAACSERRGKRTRSGGMRLVREVGGECCLPRVRVAGAGGDIKRVSAARGRRIQRAAQCGRRATSGGSCALRTQTLSGERRASGSCELRARTAGDGRRLLRDARGQTAAGVESYAACTRRGERSLSLANNGTASDCNTHRNGERVAEMYTVVVDSDGPMGPISHTGTPQGPQRPYCPIVRAGREGPHDPKRKYSIINILASLPDVHILGVNFYGSIIGNAIIFGIRECGQWRGSGALKVRHSGAHSGSKGTDTGLNIFPAR